MPFLILRKDQYEDIVYHRLGKSQSTPSNYTSFTSLEMVADLPGHRLSSLRRVEGASQEQQYSFGSEAGCSARYEADALCLPNTLAKSTLPIKLI